MKKAFKQFLCFLMLGMLTICCTEDKPTYSLTDEQLIDILVDVHLAEAALQNYYGIEKDSISEVLYNDLFSFNSIDSTEFRTNLTSLRRDPNRLKAIYTMVVEEISVQETASLSKGKTKKK